MGRHSAGSELQMLIILYKATLDQMNRLFYSFFFLIVPFLFFSGCTENSTTESNLPNIVLIFMDDMGYGDLSCYGHPLIKTPHLDQLAATGLQFTSFYAAASVCTPSRAGLLTGRYPIRNAPFNFGPESENGLPTSEVTIADILQSEGYATTAIGKWHLGHRPEFLPTARGFDQFFGLPYSNDMILPWCPWLTEDDKLYLYQDTAKIEEIGTNQDDLILDYTSKAISFIEANLEQPFFLYLAHSMPHLPISAPDRFKGRSSAGLYGDVIETVDWSIGQIIGALETNSLRENTMIIFTSDNGPWHNLPDRMVQAGVERWHTGSTGIFRGAKATTYEGGFRVPCIINWTNHIQENQVIPHMASTLDIFPTILEISRSTPPSVRLDGKSLVHLWQENEKETTHIDTFYYFQQDQLQAVRIRNWKLRSTDQGIELYNLLEDPSERYNRKEDLSQLTSDMLEILNQFALSTGSSVSHQPIVDPD